MEGLSLGSFATSLACILVISWLWKAIDWVWLKPKRLERCLRNQGFKGNSYRIFYGDMKEISQMLEDSTSKPMDHFSNDYFPRIFPFLHQTINKYGEKSFIWNGPTPTVIVSKPEHIREILMKFHDFQKPAVNPLINKVANGLIRLEGNKWAQARKLINPAFHMDKLKHMLPAFEMSSQEMINEWEKQISETGKNELEMWSFLHDMSADAISRAAFGSSFEEGRMVFELIREQVLLMLHLLKSVYIPGWRFLPTKSNRRMDEINKKIATLFKDMINKRKRAMEAGEAPKDDLLGLLLQSNLQEIQDEDQQHHGNNNNNNRKQPKVKLSLKEVIEECKLFYLAGQDTTASLLVWTLILLSKHPNWQDQAREEILTTFGNNTPNFDGLNQLKKVNMIIHEVLRLYPPPATVLLRKVCHDVTIGDMKLPAGVLVESPMIYVQQNEKYWGEDAKEFNPLRFSQGLLKASAGNMSFFSFGWGPRNCIGSNFAMLEAKMALSLILQRFSLSLSPSYVHSPTMGRGTLRPQFGANLIVQRL